MELCFYVITGIKLFYLLIKLFRLRILIFTKLLVKHIKLFTYNILFLVFIYFFFNLYSQLFFYLICISQLYEHSRYIFINFYYIVHLKKSLSVCIIHRKIRAYFKKQLSCIIKLKPVLKYFFAAS